MTAFAHRSTLIVAALAAAALVTGASAGAPAPLQLVFNGTHVPLAASPNGFGHAGDFSASGAVCPAGKAADQRVFVGQHVSSSRVYTCDDGTGTFTVNVIDIPYEHVVGGTGAWQVTSGTGAYVKLRGTGTWVTQSTHGDESNLLGLSFVTKTQGTAFIDDTAPQARFIRVGAHKLTAPAGVYTLTATFAAPDDSREETSYRLRVKSGTRTLVTRRGVALGGTVSISMTFRPPQGTHALSLELTAVDAVKNIRTITRAVILPH